MTLNNWITQWLESYKPTVRPSTYQASGYILKNRIIPRLGDYELPLSPKRSSVTS